MILRAADLADDAERRERSDHARGEYVLGSRDLGEVEVAWLRSAPLKAPTLKAPTLKVQPSYAYATTKQRDGPMAWSFNRAR